MADVSSLYPQPPAPQPAQSGVNVLLSNPANVIQLLSAGNALQASTQDLRARQAIGDVYRKNIRPDGTLDEHAAIRDIAANPDTARLAPEAVGGMLTRQGQSLSNAGAAIANRTAQMDQQAKAQAFTAGSFSMIDPTNPTEDQVHNWTVMMRRNFPQIPAAVINGIARHALTDSQGLAHGVATIRNLALGANASGRVEGAPDANTGAPTSTTQGAANVAGTYPTALPAGEAETQRASAERGSRLQASAASTAQYHADLENLKQDSKVLDNLGGPTFEVEKKLNQLSSRVAGVGVTMTPEQLKAGESFDKIANQISLNQSQLFHGSDAGLHTVVGANPSTSMSSYGREGVIDMLQGNQDAIDKARDLWLEAKSKGAPAHSYDVFIHNLGKTLDPRVFQFNRMSRDNQQKFLHNMNPADVPDFERKYEAAIANKWVAPLKKAGE